MRYEHTPIPRWSMQRPSFWTILDTVARWLPLVDIGAKALLAVYCWYPLAQKPEWQPALIALALFVAMLDSSRPSR
jgi:hypothetical protein